MIWRIVKRAPIGTNINKMSATYNFVVSDTDVGVRLDKFLATHMPEFSRSEIQRGTISVNNSSAKLSYRTRLGDCVVIDMPVRTTDVASQNISSDFDLDILYEDDDIIVIDKPRGVVMYPSAGNKTGTLVQNILAHTHLSALGGETRPGVVHRLDKNTSGVMVFAKSDAAFRGLVKTFSGYCTEMEGAAIAQAAYLNRVPFVIIRAISDKADDSATVDYPEFEKKAIEHSVRLVENFVSRIPEDVF